MMSGLCMFLWSTLFVIAVTSAKCNHLLLFLLHSENYGVN